MFHLPASQLSKEPIPVQQVNFDQLNSMHSKPPGGGLSGSTVKHGRPSLVSGRGDRGRPGMGAPQDMRRQTIGNADRNKDAFGARSASRRQREAKQGSGLNSRPLYVTNSRLVGQGCPLNITSRSGFGQPGNEFAVKPTAFQTDALNFGSQDPKSSFFGQRTAHQAPSSKPPLFINRQARGPGLKKPYSGFGGPNLQRRHSTAQGKMNIKKSLSVQRGQALGGGGIEQNIARNILHPINTKSKDKLDNFSLTGVNLFAPQQKANGRAQNEPDPRDEYWRKNFINYDSWKKEDQAVHKNKKLPRPASKPKLNPKPMEEDNDDILPQLQEGPQQVEQHQQPGMIDLGIIQEYQRKKQSVRQQRSVPKPTTHHQLQQSAYSNTQPGQNFQYQQPPVLANFKHNDLGVGGKSILTSGKPVVETQSRFTAAIQRMNSNQRD